MHPTITYPRHTFCSARRNGLLATLAFLACTRTSEEADETSGATRTVTAAQAADWKRYPGLVGLAFFETDGSTGLCTGVYLGDRMILTAAHCVGLLDGELRFKLSPEVLIANPIQTPVQVRLEKASAGGTAPAFGFTRATSE